MTKAYHRVRAGLYSFARHTVQRFVTDEETYWVVTNTDNGEKKQFPNFGECKKFIGSIS